MKLTFWGAAETVTGSRILFEHNHFRGLVDCGLFQGPRPQRDMNWSDQPALMTADCVILTHVHIDHCGYLPRLFRQGFRKPIYCSRASADLLPIMLLDAAKLQEEDARFANRVKHSHYDPALPLFDEGDALKCIEQIRGVDWDHWAQLSPDVSFRFIRSGHILGSGYAQLGFKDGGQPQTLTFSGDIGGPSPLLLREPVAVTETDYLVVESTYGDRNINRESIDVAFAEIINKVIGRGGTLIIPSFAVGRTQDLVYLIAKLQREKKIGHVPLYLDSPMAHRVSEVYLKNLDEVKDGLGHDYIRDSLSESVQKPILTPDESMLLCMSTEPKIVISASGMLQGGRVLHHLSAKLPDPKSGVLFVGYQSAGTKGRLLRGGLLSIRIHHQEITVEAEIFALDGLSAHADSDELIRWCSTIKTAPKMTLVDHGEPPSITALKARIENELHWPNVVVPKLGETITL